MTYRKPPPFHHVHLVRLVALGLAAFLPLLGARAQPEGLRHADRVRIAEAFRLADAVQDEVWPGWSEAPFALLLVTPSREYLVGHPAPSDGFEPAGYDSLLASEVYVRPRQFSPGLLATFPVAGSVPTIVVGRPEDTGKSSTAWVLTVLHEHFHQLQYSRPGYYAGVEALGLSGGDRSGMWMLDYPFPYDAPEVAAAFDGLADALLDALRSADADAARLDAAREQLRATLSEKDFRYLAFQVWQEGTARYAEFAVARAAASYTPSDAFWTLDDYVPFQVVADLLLRDLVAELESPALAERRRTAFYALGAAEALFLDRHDPSWKEHYLSGPFRLSSYGGE